MKSKIELADNPKTPLETLIRLSNDLDSSVKRQVAHNPNTPPETLKK